MAAYYNEFDPYAAQWLRNLIAAGHIAPGEVDERSICDVDSADLAGFTQCHFFAGIGVWSRALRLAGWPDDRPVWTGSCPCQPFSAAGKRSGFDDERHLWPELFRLVRERRPPIVFGEQVASKDGLQWLDAVQADLEGAGYASAAADLCAAGVGAPHIRQRLYWVADAGCVGREVALQQHRSGPSADGLRQANVRGGDGSFGRMANNNNKGLEGRRQPGCECGVERAAGSSGVVGGLADAESVRNDGALRHHQRQEVPEAVGRSGNGGLGDSKSNRPEVRFDVHGQVRGQGLTEGRDAGGLANAKGKRQRADESGRDCSGGIVVAGPESRSDGGNDGAIGRWPSPTHGFWADADWLYCRDGKWRPVEPGTFPLAHGATARVGRLRAYGNAIVPQVAQAFVEAFMECRP